MLLAENHVVYPFKFSLLAKTVNVLLTYYTVVSFTQFCVFFLAGEEAWCAVCDSAGELTDLLFCTSCGQHYHAACLEIGATPIKRAGWQCPDCKVCQTCR